MKARVLYGFVAIAVLLLVMQGHHPLQAQIQDTMNLFEIVSPAPGQIIQGPTLPISVNFRTGDGVPVVRFDIYLNDKLFYGTKPYGGTLETPALEGRFNTDDAQSPANISRSGLKAGQATVTVRLTDAQGRIFSRSQLFIYQPIAPRQTTETNAPRVRILEPYNGQHIDSQTRISVEALDDSGIVWIKILINDRMRAMGNTSPFNLDWDPIAEGYSVGSHYIMARAMDLFNNVGDSESVIVYIDNPWSGDGFTRPQGDFDLLLKSNSFTMPKLPMGKTPAMPPLFSGSSRRDEINAPDSSWAIVPARILRPDKVSDTSWVTSSGNDPVLLTPISPSNFALKAPGSTEVKAIYSSKLSTLLPPAFNGTITVRRDIATGALSVLPIFLPNSLTPAVDTNIAISQFLPKVENNVENIIPLQPIAIATQLINNSDYSLPLTHIGPNPLETSPAFRQEITNPEFTISLPNNSTSKPSPGVEADWILTLPVVASTDDQVAVWVPSASDTLLHNKTGNSTPEEFTITLNPAAISNRVTNIPPPVITITSGMVGIVDTAPVAVQVPLPGELLNAPKQAVDTNPLDALRNNYKVITSYLVKKGDTFTSIARNFNTTPAKLAQLNPQVKPDKIIADQTRLVLPEKRTHITLDSMNISSLSAPSPYIAGSGYTMVSMRSLVEAKGGVIIWLPKTRQVNAWVGNNALSVTIGKREASINSDSYLLPISAALRESRTMVPLRFMMQGMNLTLEYDPATAEYVLTSNKE